MAHSERKVSVAYSKSHPLPSVVFLWPPRRGCFGDGEVDTCDLRNDEQRKECRAAGLPGCQVLQSSCEIFSAKYFRI